MVKKKMENILAEELKKRFEESPQPKFDKIYVSKRPFLAKTLKKKWCEKYGKPLGVEPTLIPPLQPEIDMILCRGKTMIAVELKYFKRRGRGLNHSFYEGIEQTLALLRWGFDHVALWQLFEHPSIEPSELWFYAGWTWNFLHASPEYGGLNLPVEFTFMLVRKAKADQGYDFLPVQPNRVDGSIRLDVLPPPYDPRFKIRTPHRNTLLDCSEVIKLRAMLEEWLETQEP